MAVLHRDLAGVTGLPDQLDRRAPWRGDAGHDPQLAQGAPLGDVNLGVGPDALDSRLDAGQVDERAQVIVARVGRRDAARVAQRIECALGQRPDEQPRADRAGAESGRLLGRAHEQPGPGHRVGELEREHGPERAVVAAAVGDGVDVRARGDDRALRAVGQRPQVPEPVDPGASPASRAQPATSSIASASAPE